VLCKERGTQGCVREEGSHQPRRQLRPAPARGRTAAEVMNPAPSGADHGHGLPASGWAVHWLPLHEAAQKAPLEGAVVRHEAQEPPHPSVNPPPPGHQPQLPASTSRTRQGPPPLCEPPPSGHQPQLPASTSRTRQGPPPLCEPPPPGHQPRLPASTSRTQQG